MTKPNTAPNRVNHTTLGNKGFGAHRDDFTITDHLNRRELVRTMAEQIAKDQAPMVLGLHGDWGSGKTSALRAIQYHLTGENPLAEEMDDRDIGCGLHQGHLVSVWFEAWRYQNEAAPVVALLQEMRRRFSRWHKALGKAAKLGTVAFESILDGLDKASKLIGLESLPFSPKDIRASGERYEKDRLEQALPTDTVQEYLRETIKNLLPDKIEGMPSPRVVVFIDDLDRCAAESAYRLLEGLKIYLQLDNCVFVLGMNQQVVIEAIAERLKKDESDKTVALRAEAYLEKLCSNIWRLPLPTEPVHYFATLVDDDAARAAVESALLGNPALGIQSIPSFLPPNPRRLRALANVFNRLLVTTASKKLVDQFPTDLHQRLLLVAYLYQFHSELYQRWHYDSNFLARLRSWLDGTQPADKDHEPHLARLTLPTQLTAADPASAVPTGGTLQSRYPDPAAPGIFWIAPLLQVSLAKATAGEFAKLVKLDI